MLRRLLRINNRGNRAERQLSERDEESQLPLNDLDAKVKHLAVPDDDREFRKGSVSGKIAPPSPGKLQLNAIFLECGIHINELDDWRFASDHPLHWAVRKWKGPLLQCLLESTGQFVANVEDVDEKGMRPLHAAADINNLEAFKKLQAHGADLRAYRQDRNCTDQPVHTAAIACSMGVLKYLIPDTTAPEDQEFVKDTNKQGQTVLHCAVYTKKKPTVQNACIKYLLEHGAEVDAKDEMKGETPLHLACRKNLIDVVTLMADIRPEEFCRAMHMTNSSGKTPRDLAWKGPISMVTLEDQQKLMQILLDRGLPCDIEGAEGGGYALRLAAENGDEEMVERLLEGGALIYPDEFGRTAFLNATAGNHVSIMRAIFSKFGRQLTMDALDKVGNSPLHYAAANNAPDATEFLLSLGSRIVEDSNGRTPMDLAIFHRSEAAAFAFVDDFEWKRIVMHPSVEYGSVLLGLIKHLPSVMSKCLDKCMEVEKNLEDPDKSYIQYDLNIFFPPECSDEEHPNVYMAPMRALEAMASCDQDQLLAHRVCTSLLERKWLRYGMLCSLFIIIANLTVVILLTYILLRSVESDLRPYLLQKAYENAATHNHTSVNSSAFEELYRLGHNHGVAGFEDNTSLIFLVLSLLLIFFMEGVNIFAKRIRYLKEWTNYIGILLFFACAGFLISYHFHAEGYHKQNYTYQFGATAVFLAWFNLMRCCRPFGTFGIYAIMFFKIMKTLSEVMAFFLMLIFGFATAFSVLFQTQSFPAQDSFYLFQSELEPSSLRTGHDTFLSSALRIGAMTTGELDFLSTFLYPFLDGMLEYPALTVFFYVLFLILMPILLNNLLIGLAVGDMDAIRANAAALRREIQVYLHYSLEQLFPAKLLKKFQEENISYREYPEEQKSYFTRFQTWIQSGTGQQTDRKKFFAETQDDDDEPVVLTRRTRQLRLKALDPSVTKLERELEPDEILYHKMKQLEKTVQDQGLILAQILEALQKRPSADGETTAAAPNDTAAASSDTVAASE